MPTQITSTTQACHLPNNIILIHTELGKKTKLNPPCLEPNGISAIFFTKKKKAKPVTLMMRQSLEESDIAEIPKMTYVTLIYGQ